MLWINTSKIYIDYEYGNHSAYQFITVYKLALKFYTFIIVIVLMHLKYICIMVNL